MNISVYEFQKRRCIGFKNNNLLEKTIIEFSMLIQGKENNY